MQLPASNDYFHFSEENDCYELTSAYEATSLDSSQSAEQEYPIYDFSMSPQEQKGLYDASTPKYDKDEMTDFEIKLHAIQDHDFDFYSKVIDDYPD